MKPLQFVKNLQRILSGLLVAMLSLPPSVKMGLLEALLSEGRMTTALPLRHLITPGSIEIRTSKHITVQGLERTMRSSRNVVASVSTRVKASQHSQTMPLEERSLTVRRSPILIKVQSSPIPTSTMTRLTSLTFICRGWAVLEEI